MYLKNCLKLILLILISIFLSACLSAHSTGGYLSVDGVRFVDEDGRTVILNGINYVTKDPEKYFLNDNDEDIFRQFRNWGFNCVRFGMSWRGIEPEPGKINEAYLKEIDKRVKMAEKNGLWIILDMHQDLYGGKYGNGAPDWATFDDGLPHETGDVWSDAYLVSPAIHRVFDNFWNNKPASDGVGIQDHYIFVWKTLAKRYAGSRAVAGFDIMNEPFTGSESSVVLTRLLTAYGEMVAAGTGSGQEVEELLEMWGNENSRTEALESLNNKDIYRHIINSAYDDVKKFEQGTLSSFYQRVRDAIREVNKNHILFLEHSYFSNLGVKSSFLIPKGKDKQPDPLCAYAPHGYDLVTDTDAADKPGYNRVEVIFEQIEKAAQEKKVPVLIGEWGAFYLGREYLKPAQQLISIFEEAQFGQTYWAYWNNIESQDYFSRTLSRIYPMRTNGRLISYKNDFDQNIFTMEWDETNPSPAPTVVYLSDLNRLKKNITFEPESEISFLPIVGSTAGYLQINPLYKKRTLKISNIIVESAR